MPNKHIIACISMLLALSLAIPTSYAQTGDGFGQVIQITTRFHSFVGKPSWLLVIRDLDHDQNIPYIFDITRGQDYWVAYTYGRNYLITASTLQMETYKSVRNSYKNYKIHDFCHLESQGRIQRGVSLAITISGELTPDGEAYTCHLSTYVDQNWVVAQPNA